MTRSFVVLLLTTALLITAAAAGAAKAIIVPESTSETIASRCECLLDVDCGVCSAHVNDTVCLEDVSCFWRDTTNQNKLAAHTLEFDKPEVVQVAEGVYVAVGFGLANSVLFVGPEGGVVVDTMESTAAAENVMTAFRPLLRGLPIVGIIFTHAHSDHVYGTTVFASNSRNVPIIAQRSHSETIRDGNLVTGAIYPRSQRQFGTMIPTSVDGHLNSGIGPALLNDNTTYIGYMDPTLLFDSELEITLGGLDFVLVNTPGETSDHAFVYVPSLKLGCVGDNIYKTFPNLYSIRGTRARSLRSWFTSIDRVIDFNTEILVGSHTKPLSGADEIRSVLTTYRDAIQFVHDQTVRQLNMGHNAEEIIGLIELPDYLNEHPYLQQFYGTVTWGVRAVVDFYLGWFEGRASVLNPLPWRIQAKRLVALAGGSEQALDTAVTVMKENTVDSLQWALQLGEAVLYDDPNNARGRQVVSQCMKFLGYLQTSANGRNYYLSESSKIAGNREFDINTAQSIVSFVRMPIYSYMYQVPITLNTRQSHDVENFAVAYVFSESWASSFVVRVRREVAEIREYANGESIPGPIDLAFYCSESAFKTYVLFPEEVTRLVARGWVSLSPPQEQGGYELLDFFESLFEKSGWKHDAHEVVFKREPALRADLLLA